MIDPVEIDITMRQNVSEESQKAEKDFGTLAGKVTQDSASMQSALTKLGYTADKAFEAPISKTKELSDQIRIQKGVIADLESQYKRAYAEFNKTNISNPSQAISGKRDEAKRMFQEIRKELDMEKKSLSDLEKEYNKFTSTQAKATQAQKTYLAQMRSIREEMVNLRQEGKKDSDRYKELEKDLTAVGTAYRVVNQQQKQLTTAGSGLAGFLSGVSGVAGVFSSAQGALSLFAQDNEKLAAIQTKLQAAMAITIGLQQVSNTLHQTSAFRINTVTKMTNLWTAANTRLAVALGVSTVAAQVLMATLTLGLSVAITAIIAGLNKLVSEQKKAAEEQKKFADSVAASSQSVITDFERLRKSYTALGDSLEAKEKYIIENQEAFKKLGVSINDVNDADSVFIKNSDAFKESVLSRARAAAAMEIASEKYKQSIAKMMEADNVEKNIPWYDKQFGHTGVFERNGVMVELPKHIAQQGDKIREESAKLEEEAGKYIDWYIQYDTEAKEQLREANIKTLDSIENDTKEWWEAYKKIQDDALAQIKSSDIGSPEWARIIAERDKAARILEKYNTTKTSKQEDREQQRQIDAGQKLSERRTALLTEQLKHENDMREKSIELLDDSFAKRYQLIELAYDKELAAIHGYEDKVAKEQADYARQLFVSQNGTEVGFDFSKFDLTKLPEGLRPEDVAGRVKDMTDAAVDAWSKARMDIVRDEVEMMREEEMAFSGSLDRELSAINKHYDDRVRAAKGNAALIQMIEENREKEISDVASKYELARIDMESDIAAKRIKILNRPYLFEADRRKEELERLRKDAESRLSILKAQYDKMPTPELAGDIEQATVELEGFEAELEKMPVHRLREVLQVFKSIASELSGLGGNVGEFFSGVVAQIDNIDIAFDQSATLAEKAAAGLSGIVSIIGMLSSASSQRKEAEREFYQNSIALAHEYSLALNEQLRIQSELSGSGFINDYSGRLNDGYKALTDATEKYNEAVAKLGDGKAKIDLRNAIDWGNVGKGAASGAAAGAAIGSIVPVIGTAVGAVVGGIAGFFGGLFGGKKKKNEYGGLLDVFPELVDGAGKLNKELAQTIIDTNQVDDNTKQLLQNTLDWANAIEAANEQIKAITVELAGDLGSDLKTAIVDAWKAGEGGATRMFDAASKSLENFVENMLYSMVYSDVFDEFGKRLAESLNPEIGDGDILDDFDWLMRQMDERDDAYIAMLDAFKKRAAERGYNLWTPEEEEDTTAKRTGATVGKQIASQDSVTALTGGINALRILANDMANIEREQRDISISALSVLNTIAENTAFCRILEDVNSTLEYFKTFGMKMK